MKLEYIDHIVLIVRDLKETERFYSNFLGEPEHKYEDTLTYRIGNTQIFFGLYDQEWQTLDKDRGGINHIAFGVRTSEELKEFEKVLNDAGIKNSGVGIDKYGHKEFIWFDDPNGYRLEFYCRPE